MKVNIPEDPGSQRVWGKEILIVIVVICSALSFSLGYFVGLGQGDKNPLTGPPAADPAPVTQAPAAPQPEKSENPSTGGPQEPNAPAEKTSPSVAAKQQETVSRDEPAAAAPLKAPEQKTAPLKKDTPASVSKDTPAADPGQTAVYTVQLGAIKNPVEARRLKERLAKKGFKATIVVAKNQKNEKIYKVRTGEFAERREAEVLALRLKKNEGLNAFVTPKNE